MSILGHLALQINYLHLHMTAVTVKVLASLKN